MKTMRTVIIIFATLVIVTACAFFAIGLFKPKPAGIYVSTQPQANVYINGELSGVTPFQKTINASTINLRLVPVGNQSLFPFETKITLVGGIQTLVRREFGSTDDNSSGDIISFEYQGGQEASLVVVSTPDNAQVSLDGVPTGFTPYKISSITQGDHQVSIKAKGYIDRSVTVSTKPGYRLTLFAKLSKNPNGNSAVASPTPSPSPSNFVMILTTPTGYLRVRTEPGTKGEEIGQVKPGEKFPYLGTDSDTGWIKIQFEEVQAGLPNGISGWISNQYAKIVDSSGNPVSIPTPGPTPF